MRINLPSASSAIVVPGVEFAGHKSVVQVNMILDTGAGYTLIDSMTAETLGYNLRAPHKRVTIVTANGRIHAPLIHVRKISIGNIFIKDIPVICHDIPGIVEASGLLGLNFLRHFRTVIDYRKFTLEIL